MSRKSSPRNRVLAAAASLAALTLFTACGGPSASPAAELPAAEDELVEQAKAEGEVSLGLGGHTTAQAELLAAEFEKKYGIDVTFVREASGSIAQKVQAQAASGNIAFDAVSLNDAATLQVWQEEGLLADPNLPDRDALIDKLVLEEDSSWVPYAWAPLGYLYNDARVDPADAPTTWTELTEQDGVFAAADPGTSGSALTFFAAMNEIDKGFVERLGQKNTLISESALALTQMVATGEAAYGFPGSEPDVMTAKASGEPMAMGYPDGEIVVMSNYIAAISNSGNPAAGRLLVQYQLSEEFQAIQAEHGTRSVLEAAKAPEGLEQIEIERLKVMKPETMVESRDSIVEMFSSSIGK